MKLSDAETVKAYLRRMLRPRSKLGRTTLWFGMLALLLQASRLIARSPQGSMLSGWSSFLTFVFAVCAALMLMRWGRKHLLWRLRNRLIVTYVFIGVIPVILLVAMGLIAGYLFAGQFATYVALSDLQSELNHLQTANDAIAGEFRNLMRSGKLTPELAAEIASATEERFLQRRVQVQDDQQSYIISPGGRVEPSPRLNLPEQMKGKFSGFVVENNRLSLRAMKSVEQGSHRLTVISTVPITSELLRLTAWRLGSVALYPPVEDTQEDDKTPQPTAKPEANSKPAAPASTPAPSPKSSSNDQITFDIGGKQPEVRVGNNKKLSRAALGVEAGTVPPATTALDYDFRFGTIFPVTEWDTGKTQNAAMLVQTRPSLLYAILFAALGEKGGIFINLLVGVAIFFGVIELVALFIGVRLTRSMTRSVSDLYVATEHVNRGDLTHQIQVKTRDQMAALEGSFNSMTQSLSRLIAEQKEKQRLQSELAIAHEVQALLFPRDASDMTTLEVHGVCQPARTVSGDYYDFIPLTDDRMMLAVGDISGKGISAALLMATVHAFVRAYSLEPDRTMALVAAEAGAGLAEVGYYSGGNGGQADRGLSLGSLMATLNYQLYRSTPPEKYATMFLGHYDARHRSLTYSNAGHLPPMMLNATGHVSRLETSGTVVGLFDGMSYDESTCAMHPGDIFVAFSDGVTEPENEFGEFGEDRLIELIQLHRDQPLSRISEVVIGAVADWIGGNEQPDDITLVLARAR